MPTLYCPYCKGCLTSVSRRHDYYCAPCRVAVCLDGETGHVYELGSEKGLRMATQSLLRPIGD